MKYRLHNLFHPATIRGRMRILTITFTVLAAVILTAAMSLLVMYNSLYEGLLYNVTTASEFNQDFKENIDLKMYYYVIESQYSEGLPIDEVIAAQDLARALLDTTTQKDSRRAITSVLDLCENLEEKIYQIEDTKSYDERQLQLENNIYVLTALIEEFMYTYLYCEAVQLNVLQNQIARQIFTEFLFITALTGALIFLFTQRTVRLSRSITKPILDLCARVEDIGSGKLSVRKPIQSSEYEIRTLSEGFEQMVGRLNRQIQENNQKQDSLRRTELALIQAQINPHFLYNVLSSIKWKALRNGDDSISDIAGLTATFYRTSLNNGEAFTSVSSELNNVRAYVEIQKHMHEFPFTVEYDVEPEALDCQMLNFLLQPIVENAFKHGIDYTDETRNGRLIIRCYTEDKYLFFQIKNNGPQIEREKAQQALNLPGKRYGLFNIQERIQLYYMEDCGIEADIDDDGFTSFTVRILKSCTSNERNDSVK